MMDACISADWLIPDVVAAFPTCREVFDRHGLRGCGGVRGPVETVAWFARMHQIPLDDLLRELDEAASRRNHLHAFTPAPPSLADTIYQPFFIAASAIVVTIGALWGAAALAQMGISGGAQFALPYGWLLAHGQAMMFGFVVLMVMGFAYQALPRFKNTELWNPSLAVASLPLMIAGLALQIIGHLFAPPPIFQSDPDLVLHAPLWSLIVGTTGAVLQWLSVTVFVIVMWRTLKRAKLSEAYDHLMFAAFAWLWLSALANVVLFSYWGTAFDKDSFVNRVGPWNPPLRDAQMFGFATQLILGMSLRYLPHAYGFVAPSLRWARTLFIGVNLAVLFTVAGFPVFMLTHRHAFVALSWFGYLILFALMIGHIAQMKLLSAPPERDRGLKFIRAAFAWGLVGLMMMLCMRLYNTATGQPFSHNYFAAYRHAILAGFVLLMIIGVSSKVVPLLAGLDVREANPLWTAFVLLNLGNLARVAGQTLWDLPATKDTARVIAAAAGFVQWAGIVLWADDLWRTLALARRQIAPNAQLDPIAEIGSQARVAAVLERYPQTLEVFLRHGFAPLRNPTLRKTVARAVTLEEAARRGRVDLGVLLNDLRVAAGLTAPTARGDSVELPPPATVFQFTTEGDDSYGSH